MPKGQRSFCCDWREAYVISNSCGMGDPLDSRFREAGRTAEGGGITRPQLFEMTRPGASEQKKDLCPLGTPTLQEELHPILFL